VPDEPKEWKQERPAWCPHEKHCLFRRRGMDAMCGGELPIPQPHDPGGPPVNTHRVCINEIQSAQAPRAAIFDLQVNDADLDWFRWIYDALDGRKTGTLSGRDDRARMASLATRVENVLADAQELQKKLAGTEHEPLAMGMATELGYVLNSLTETKRISAS